MVKRTSDSCYLAEAAYPAFIAAHPEPTPCVARPELFTAYDDRRGTRRRREHTARILCQGCPLKDQCREWATRTYQIGVWGGTTAFERTNIRKREERRAVA